MTTIWAEPLSIWWYLAPAYPVAAGILIGLIGGATDSGVHGFWKRVGNALGFALMFGLLSLIVALVAGFILMFTSLDHDAPAKEKAITQKLGYTEVQVSVNEFTASDHGKYISGVLVPTGDPNLWTVYINEGSK